MTYFQSEVDWNWFADGLGAQTVSQLWTNWRKLVSYFSSGLHFDPEQLHRCPPVRLHISSFWLPRISTCFSLSQPFLLTLLYLDIFRWRCQWGLHFSTPCFHVLDRTVHTNPSLSPLLLLMLSFCDVKRWRLLFFGKLGTVFFFFFFLTVGVTLDTQQKSTPKGPLQDEFLFLVGTQKICHQWCQMIVMNGRLLILDQIQLHWISLRHIWNVASPQWFTFNEWKCPISDPVGMCRDQYVWAPWQSQYTNISCGCVWAWMMPSTLLRLHDEAVSVPLSYRQVAADPSTHPLVCYTYIGSFSIFFLNGFLTVEWQVCG